MGEKIKPCFFCGGQAGPDAHIDPQKTVAAGYRVRCLNIKCQAAGPIRASVPEAVRAWNIRKGRGRIGWAVCI